MRASTAFVEVTDPFRPAVVGHLPTAAGIDAPGSFWRDIKTIGHHALIVSEEPGHGLQVFDLERLLDANATNGTTPLFEATTRHGGFSNAHNLFVHEEAGFAYVVGSSACGGGMYVLDVTDPASPAFAGCYTQDGYVHGESWHVVALNLVAKGAAVLEPPPPLLDHGYEQGVNGLADG